MIDIQIYLISDLLSLRNIFLSLKFAYHKSQFVLAFYRLEKAKIFCGFMNYVPRSMLFCLWGFANLISKNLRPLKRYTCEVLGSELCLTFLKFS